MRPYSSSFRLPQPSFRLAPESRAYDHIHHHSGSPNRHSGASRNPGRAIIFPVIPTPPTVIPAQAGIQGARSSSPSFRLPQPSFRRQPESRAYGHIHRHPDSPNRHSGASRNLGVRSYSPSFRLPQPSFQRKPESRECDHIHRHSGASRNPGRAIIPTVIPAPPTVIPAQAGIYACRLHYSSRKLRPWIPAQAGMTVVGAPQ